MKKCLVLLLLTLGLLRGYTQDQVIKGKVTDENGKPLTGATVTIKNTNNSTTTDADGNFQITAGTLLKPVLVISYVGYTSSEVIARPGGSFPVSLQPDSKALNDVVVVGYGTQRKRDVTGATATITIPIDRAHGVACASRTQGTVLARTLGMTYPIG